MEVRIISHTPDPQRIVAAAARLCYSPISAAQLNETMNEDTVARICKKMITSGHTSTLEHAVFTFAVDGVSRVLTHQLIRHRLASYEQQSQRYTTASDQYIIPNTIIQNPEWNTAYNKLLKEANDLYIKMVNSGIPKEDARYVLPQSMCSRIIITMNARELMHFFALRCCTRAQWEIRQLAEEMLKQIKEIAPVLFNNVGPSCVQNHGICPEEHSCGKWRTIVATIQGDD